MFSEFESGIKDFILEMAANLLVFFCYHLTERSVYANIMKYYFLTLQQGDLEWSLKIGTKGFIVLKVQGLLPFQITVHDCNLETIRVRKWGGGGREEQHLLCSMVT